MTATELIKLINAGFTKTDLVNLGFDFPTPETKTEPKPEPKPEPGNRKTWDDVYNALTGLISTIQAGNIVNEGVKDQPKKDEFWGLDKIINPMSGEEV